MRLFLSVAALKKWTVKTTDIKSAFLQGKGLDRDIYIKTPTESKAPQHIIWKLKHGLYGLKDGARQFYESVKEELLKLLKLFCFGSLVILDVARCYLWLFTLYINIKISKNSC